jgi:dihydropteroate synthase
MKLMLAERVVELDDPVVMGILNVTPDSFSDGGDFSHAPAALQHARVMIEQGAQIIDVGGESTRPGARAVDSATEIDRVVPLIRQIRSGSDVLISVDTRKAEVARAALEAGADIVNDISALGHDGEMAALVASWQCPVILMHMQGTPETMQENPHYEDVMADLQNFFRERIGFALEAGIGDQQIILDPGIGFGKRLQDNIDIIKNLWMLSEFKKTLLIGLSRKRFLGSIAGEREASERDYESLVAHVAAWKRGAQIFRVHNVAATVRGLKVARALF